MDPITGISLAASVIQLVQFSSDVVTRYRDISQHGSPAEYTATKDTTEQLASIAGALQQRMEASITSKETLSQDEKDLYELSRKCEECAKTLLGELRRLRIDIKGSPIRIIQKTCRSIWKTNKIDKIKQDLETYRAILQTSLLSRLSKRFDAQNLQHSDSFKNLDTQLQHIVTCLAASITSLEDLTVQQSEQTRQHISAEVARFDQQRINRSIYDQTIQSLLYPDIFLRQQQSQLTAFGDTYDFVFNEPNDSNESWSSFVKWLKSEDEVYWINGKAGSGKSTLMNYIRGDSRKEASLQEWHPDRQLLTPSFFFWAAGSPLQRSVLGLLRSLIYQIIANCPDLLTYCKMQHHHDLTEQALTSTLLRLVLQNEVPLAICMFVDGLDEFEGPNDSIIELITHLSSSPFVKLCVSSRPLHTFEKAFKHNSSLRLQDLTRKSLQVYARAQLSEHLPLKEAGHSEWYRANEFVDNIVSRADGVFLWAVIVIREVREGLQEEASMSELEKMMGMLPNKLEDLFASMLNRIKHVYRRDAARFLQIALQSPTSLDLCGLHLSFQQEDVEDAPFEHEKIPSHELVRECNSTSVRLLTHTAGLLEIIQQEGEPRGQLQTGIDSQQSFLYFRKVNFIHRTARDFLYANNGARLFIQQHGFPKAAIHLSLARGLLVRIVQQPPHPVLHYSNPVCSVFQDVLTHISVAEDITGQAQSELMNSLDYESLAQHYRSDKPSNDDFVDNNLWEIGPALDGIDLIGMAASTSMTRYVCSKLKLVPTAGEASIISESSYSRVSCRPRQSEVMLKWPLTHNSEGKRILCASTCLQVSQISQKLHLQDYRREIISYFELPADYDSDKSKIIESYLLSCCTNDGFSLSLRSSKLMCTLLQAGANAMVTFYTPSSLPEFGRSAWVSWLRFLVDLRHEFMRIHRRSGNIVLTDHWTVADIAITTQAFLNSGVDMNLMLETEEFLISGGLKRSDLWYEHLGLEVSPTAGFVLQECLGQIPDFYQLTKDIKPNVRRKITGIKRWDGEYFYQMPLKDNPDTLWPLIDKWERSGRRTDLDALLLAMRAAMRALEDTSLPESISFSEDEDVREE